MLQESDSFFSPLIIFVFFTNQHIDKTLNINSTLIINETMIERFIDFLVCESVTENRQGVPKSKKKCLKYNLIYIYCSDKI